MTARESPPPAPWKQWGTGLDPQAIRQMENACRLPVALRGALMPDAQVGYGLPIGGVLAVEQAVIPYAVGVDIACRMKLSVYDIPGSRLAGQADRWAGLLERETRFGIGACFRERKFHPVLDEDWTVSPVTARHRDKAWSQLGTSGSGNHFVEFGLFTIAPDQAARCGVSPGCHLALLSHSGSRGTGAQVCAYYSRRARELHPGLPGELRSLAWLPLDSPDGQEYWRAMQLMGHYAAANHDLIHRAIARALGETPVLDIENHHNFAWIETHRIGGQPREVVVHRKGATPAGPGVPGIIPGSMASPAFLVRGRGNEESLQSAAHGAGRVMSRHEANRTLTWNAARKVLDEHGVRLLSAGLDEVPMVYKDIHQVMAAQTDLVEIVARFDPKIVKMAPAGHRAED
jgi:tRNA-splicing ligase RtcB